MPPELENVVVFDQLAGKTMGFYFEPAKCFIRDLDGFRLENVTHYLQLPENPDISLSDNTKF